MLVFQRQMSECVRVMLFRWRKKKMKRRTFDGSTRGTGSDTPFKITLLTIYATKIPSRSVIHLTPFNCA